MAQHLFGCRTCWFVGSGDLDSMVDSVVSAHSTDIGCHLAAFDLARQSDDRRWRKRRNACLEDGHRDFDTLVVPERSHAAFASNEARAYRLWSPFRRRGGVGEPDEEGPGRRMRRKTEHWRKSRWLEKERADARLAFAVHRQKPPPPPARPPRRRNPRRRRRRSPRLVFFGLSPPAVGPQVPYPQVCNCLPAHEATSAATPHCDHQPACRPWGTSVLYLMSTLVHISQAHFLRTHFPEVDISADLIRDQVTEDALEAASLSQFDPFEGNTLEIVTGYDKQTHLIFPMGELGSELSQLFIAQLESQVLTRPQTYPQFYPQQQAKQPSSRQLRLSEHSVHLFNKSLHLQNQQPILEVNSRFTVLLRCLISLQTCCSASEHLAQLIF